MGLDRFTAEEILDAIEGLCIVWNIEGEPGRLPDEEWEILRKMVLRRDEYKCKNCLGCNEQLDVHHIVPVASGGSNRLTNLATLCYSCHCKIHPWMAKERYGLAIAA